MTEDFQLRTDPRTAADMPRVTHARCWLDEEPATIALYEPIRYGDVSSSEKRAVVVGAGPGGLFAALRLIEVGVKPVLIERGKNVDERRLDIAKISREGTVNSDSNYCFGEGGAGAYSDGKLYTRSKKRGSVDRILQIFNQFGASDDILIDAHPHIGSDKLPGVIRNMRNRILESGGEVHFSTTVTSLKLKEGEVVGVVCADGREFDGPVILATGHSARDVYRMLDAQSVCIRGEYLPAAEYSFVTQVDGRGVYSFCMCPGGIVVPAASGAGQLVVNGMSPSNRGSRWANSFRKIWSGCAMSSRDALSMPVRSVCLILSRGVLLNLCHALPTLREYILRGSTCGCRLS